MATLEANTEAFVKAHQTEDLNDVISHTKSINEEAPRQVEEMEQNLITWKNEEGQRKYDGC